MADFGFAIRAVLPLFLVMGAGVILRVAMRLGKDQVKTLHRVTFYLLLPCMLFKSAYNYTMTGENHTWLYIYCALTFIAATVALMLIAPRFIKDPGKCGAFVHSAFRPNCVIVGIPIAINLFGETFSQPAVMIAMLFMPLFNILGVITLSVCNPQEKRISVWQVLRDIIRNPLVIGMSAGFFLNLLSVGIPDIVMAPVSSLAAAATPLAMLVIGMGFDMTSLNHDMRLIWCSSLIKVVVWPLLFSGIGILLGFRGPELVAIYMLYAVPTAANSGIITEMMGSDGTLSAEITLVSTILSMVTIISGVTLLKYLAFV